MQGKLEMVSKNCSQKRDKRTIDAVAHLIAKTGDILKNGIKIK